MRKSAGDNITFQPLYHCCIHSHRKTYPNKAVEKEKAAWPSKGQGPDKAMIKVPTTWTSRRGRPGQSTEGGHRVCNRGSGTRTAGGQQEDSRRTPGGPEKDTGLASVARGRQQQEENWRTRDKKRTMGGPARPEDKRRTRPGHRARTQSSGARPATLASAFFLRTPAVNCWGGNQQSGHGD